MKTKRKPNNYTIGQRIRYLKAMGYTVIPPSTAESTNKINTTQLENQGSNSRT